ncbi:HD domain-containing protein [Hymenobacter aerilatus]|uniref:HD domain-containing protein n=1 Tax=Hymenobacter aerilatus TaxID=2932251 RepID=A0A8T9ST31_9BACT|nr:HD domain-containing protein [Hymenobacter aerilatus]UOR05302.1 HD domain-containing protein [Hymenobacter aerilatus]
MMDCQRAETYVLHQLQHLSPTLYYHGLHHTLDVVAQAESLADAEGVVDVQERALLRTAAFFHDTGFLTTYQGHEEAGCDLARQALPSMGYTADQIGHICRLIMATQMPQNPGDSHLAQILCDADLDYLGRPDFLPISNTLLQELQARGKMQDLRAWQELQVTFLSEHRYWTRTALQRREAGKQAHLTAARAVLNA